MMVMTAKVNFKKIVAVLAAVAGVILALILLLGGRDETAPTATGEIAVPNNDARVQFLESFGWEVSDSPVESGQVRIPQEQTEVYQRYNAWQKSQGYDLSNYGGKTAMRYVYKINNFPNATEPVYATLLVYKNQVIGGDITDTSADGVIQGFRKQDAALQPTQEATQPSTEPTATAPAA